MKKFIVPGVIVVLLACAAVVMFQSEDRKYLTATFDRTVAVYAGSEVRVLGVHVGEVESVEPAGTKVKIRIGYDAEVGLPADVQALIVTPSVVGDRFVQLAPVYSGGEQFPDDGEIDMGDTSTPL